MCPYTEHFMSIVKYCDYSEHEFKNLLCYPLFVCNPQCLSAGLLNVSRCAQNPNCRRACLTDPEFQYCHGILNKKQFSLFHQILFCYQEADYYGSSARGRLQSEAKMVSPSYVETKLTVQR